MKDWVILLSFLLFVVSCLKTEVIGYEPPEQAVVTMAKKERPMPPKPPKDTTERQDTARVPISFDPSVEDWNKTNVDL